MGSMEGASVLRVMSAFFTFVTAVHVRWRLSAVSQCNFRCIMDLSYVGEITRLRSEFTACFATHG